MAEADPDDERYPRDLRVSYDRIGDALNALGKTAEALTVYQEALAIAEAGLVRSPENADHLAGVAIEACHVGEMQLALGRLDEALVAFHRQHDAARARVDANPSSSYAQRDLGVALYKMGEFHIAAAALETDDAGRADRWRNARDWFGRCHDKFTQLRDDGLLWTSDAGVLDEIAGEIARCDAALARFGSEPDVGTTPDRS